MFEAKRPDGLIFVDTETGGLDPNVHAIVEIAFAVTDLDGNNISKKMDFKVLSQGIITPEAAKINKYDEEVWGKEAINFKDFMNIFNYCFTNDKRFQWAGSNPKFDYDFIAASCIRDNIKFEPSLFSHHFLDVGSMCWPLFYSSKTLGIRQSDLSTYFNLGEQKHGAAADVDQCIKIYQRFIKPHVTTVR